MEMKKCPFCFETLNDDNSCPSCGKDIGKNVNTPNRLPMFTVLDGRFEVGAVSARDKYCIEYFAYDNEKNDVCHITEFFPQDGVTRADDKLTAVASEESMKDFKYSFRRIKERTAILETHNNLESIIPIRKSFEENETFYYASDVIEGITLREYSKGEMKAVNAFSLIKPVVKALGVLHNAGIIHRGVSPDTIIVTDKGKLILTGLEFARDCMSRSELTVMLKSGFSAPEQYSSSGQGPWTDVYGICATIYWMISGSTPPDFFELTENGNALEDLSSMAYGITAEQNNAIMKGLSLKAADRWQNVSELEKAIYEGINSVLAPENDETNANNTKKGSGNGLSPAVIVGSIAAIIIIILIIMLFI